MEARSAEVRRNRRGKFQRRSQKRLLQRLAVGIVVSRMPELIVKKQRLIFFPAVVVFRGEDSSVTGRLPIGVFLFLQQNTESVSPARVGVKIQVVTKDLRQPHRNFWRFPGLLHSIKERIIQLPGNCTDFDSRGNGLYFRSEATLGRNNLQHAVRINLVIDLAQVSVNRPSHSDRITSPHLPQVKRLLRRLGRIARILMAQTKLFQRRSKIVACQHSLLGRQHNLRTNRSRLFLPELHLPLKFSGRGQSRAKNIRKHAGPETQHDDQDNHKTTIHSFTSQSPKLATRDRLPRTLLSQPTIAVKRESNLCVQSPNLPPNLLMKSALFS